MKRFAKSEGFFFAGRLPLMWALGFFFPVLLPAQQTDSVLLKNNLLPEFTIRELRFERSGYKVLQADTLPLNCTVSLSDRLLWENKLDVRANAPGTLATLSIRGAGPNRTPIFWNGLNLQSSMNGVMDAALIPVWPEDALEIQYGGQSAAQSSGAMGGAVLLTQGQQTFDKGMQAGIQAAMGSFGRQDAAATLKYSGNKLASMVRASTQQADNDFTFQKKGLDGNLYPAKQVNNGLKIFDIQQYNALKINDQNSLKTAVWMQRAFRELPPLTTEAARQTWQRDHSVRALMTWEFAPDSRRLWTTRAAWINDYLGFHLAGDTDTSRSRQILISTERSSSITKQWAVRAGATGLRQWAQVDGYADSTQWVAQTRLATYAMGEWHNGNRRFSALLRQEWVENQAAPFTGTLGGQIGLGRVGAARFHFSRNFNLPTLNDRYWKNLGKVDLRPEKGYSADLGWELNGPDYSLELTGFQLMLDDWILWQPDSIGLFRPDNLRKVWSRGLETQGKWHVKNGKWETEFSARFQVSKTSAIAVYGGSESVLGMQLPYTPKVSGGLSIRVSRGILSAAYLHQFTGKRLDNSGKSLQSFQVGQLLASCSLWKNHLALDMRLENLWNTSYEIIRYRPMPGRAWKLGIRWQW